MEYSNADVTHELTELIKARKTEGVQESDIRKELGWCIDDAFGNNKECPWCGKPCPDAHKPQGCWFPDCPDEPHAI